VHGGMYRHARFEARQVLDAAGRGAYRAGQRPTPARRTIPGEVP
jgi:hypothetical protein